MRIRSGSEEEFVAVIQREFENALEMARKTRAGEQPRYSNPFDTGNQWINHAHELLKMRARVLGETVPEPALEHIRKLEEELTEVRKEFSEMFRLSMENGREATQFLADAHRTQKKDEAPF